MADRRLPASRCAGCERTIGEALGKRIIHSLAAGVLRVPETRDIGVIRDRGRAIRLSGRFSQLFVILWGCCWTDQAISRAVDEANAGQISWLCQHCAGLVCGTCGWVARMPMGVDVVHDDGSIGHVGIFPGSAGCLNPSCGQRLSGIPGRVAL